MVTQNITAQRERIYKEFGGPKPKTMLMVARATGIERANVCWDVHDLMEAGRVFPVYKGLCKITRDRATYYTSNPKVLFSHFINRTQFIWERFSDDSTILLFALIRDYCLNHYSPVGLDVPPCIRGAWENDIKPLIDKEAIK